MGPGACEELDLRSGNGGQGFQLGHLGQGRAGRGRRFRGVAGVAWCEGLKKPGHHPGEPLPPGGGAGGGAGTPLGVMGRSLLAGWRDALNPQRTPPWAVMFL